MAWDPTRIKAQIRYAAQRLGQLQDKLDSQGQITKGDISTLLYQGNIVLARAKAQKVIKDEIRGDLLQVLEMYLGVVLEHFGELDKSDNPSPVLVEAASSIIYAALQIEVKELHAIRELLIQRLGPDFARSAISNHDNYVSPRVVRALSAPPPSAARLDDYLASIASTHGIPWTPDLRPHEKLTALSEILDLEATPIVDLPQLRSLCAYGLPEQPSWLRPRIWRILLGLLPIVKSNWTADARKQRDSYYDLVRRLLEPFEQSPPPSTPHSSSDATLLDVVKQLSRVPPNLYSHLEEESDSASSCPLNDEAPDDIRISSAENLDSRLALLTGPSESDSETTPEIRIESDETTPEIQLESEETANTPQISVTAPDSLSSRRHNAPKTLLSAHAYGATSAHRKHMSALVRLLYIHSVLNPANHSPHMASILIPLYSVLNTEVELDDLAHAEADTFWLFEAIVGEFSELEDEAEGHLWMKKFGERLSWADPELSMDLQAKGLDPSLPHYSYRWLAPLLTHTLPMPSVWLVWDVLFSRPMRERDSNPKLEGLLDVCTSMLIRARAPLFRLGKPGQRSPGLWTEENIMNPPPSPLRAWELSDAFLEGMSLLQLYPVEAAGGIDRVLQTAADLSLRRQAETRVPQADNASLTARLRDTVWRGFTNQVTSAPNSPALSAVDEDTESSYDDGDATEPVQQGAETSGFTSRLANTVWRGITNKSAMDAPPTPLSATEFSMPSPPSIRAQSMSPAPPSPLNIGLGFAQEQGAGTANLWSYAEKLRDSDAAAKLAKASTNWRVKALEAWGNRSATTPKSPPTSPPSSKSLDLTSTFTSRRKQSRMSEGYSPQPSPLLEVPGKYVPPERPAFFQNPRDSMYIDPRALHIDPRALHVDPRSGPASPNLSSSEASPLSDAGSAVSSSGRPKRTGPKPLLLGGGGTLMTSTTPISADKNQWAESIRRAPMSRDSMSSASSVSPTDFKDFMKKARNRTESRDWDSETTQSRIVPLKRGSVSPAASASRMMSARTMSTSSAASSDRGSPIPEERITRGSDGVSSLNHSRLPSPDSPTTLPSSPPPKTPTTSISLNQAVHISNAERQQGSIVLSESSDVPEDAPVTLPSFIRRKTPSPTPRRREDGDASDSSAGAPARSHLRRQPPRLRIRDSAITADHLTASPNTLTLPSHESESGLPTPKAGETFEFPPAGSPRSPRKVRKASGESVGEVRTRKLSSENRETRSRKASADGEPAQKLSGEVRDARPRKTSDSRIRKISTESRGSRKTRSSVAIEGDDEGYDDLLSAYESG